MAARQVLSQGFGSKDSIADTFGTEASGMQTGGKTACMMHDACQEVQVMYMTTYARLHQ